MSEEARDLLTEIGVESSLRYAIHMITVANLVCQRRKGTQVEIQDVKRVYSLFMDVKRSSEFLLQYQQSFVFHEVPDEEEGGKGGDAHMKD